MWLARLFLRAGRTDEAEAAFRAVTLSHPTDIDARIGLAMALTRRGAWEDALTILREVEPAAGENADAFGALARAYRRGGDDQNALEYFQRARALSPDDPDLVMGYEAVARTHGHWIAVEGFGQAGGPDTTVTSGSIVANARVWRQLHLEATGRVQQGPDYSDAIGGGGFRWRMARPTTIAFQALGGPDNIALATADLSVEVIRYAGLFEIGASVRRLTFAGASVRAASPLFAWTPVDAWRVDGRYTYSRSTFDETGDIGRRSLGDAASDVARLASHRRAGHLRLRHRKLRRSDRRPHRFPGRHHGRGRCPHRFPFPDAGHHDVGASVAVELDHHRSAHGERHPGDPMNHLAAIVRDVTRCCWSAWHWPLPWR